MRWWGMAKQVDARLVLVVFIGAALAGYGCGGATKESDQAAEEVDVELEMAEVDTGGDASDASVLGSEESDNSDEGSGGPDGSVVQGEAEGDVVEDGGALEDAAILGEYGGDWVLPDELKLCGGEACACANGIDDDGDGAIDGFDLECTGPGDADEGSFATGIAGDNQDPKWQDCYFDGNSGAGDDACRYPTACSSGELPLTDSACLVSDECVDFCRPRTPNGCDCFGCCEVRDGAGTVHHIVITEACDADHLAECQACVQAVGLCDNPCGECELCPGKTPDDLPDSCYGTAPMTPGSEADAGTGEEVTEEPVVSCDDGEESCQSTQDCPGAKYCSYGCCLGTTLL